jgi:hypothetical protein
MRNCSIWTMVALTLLSVTAFAQQPAREGGDSGGKKNARKPRVIKLEEIKIEGRIQKPNAFYILNRSNIGYSITELKTTFIPHVVNSVRKHPF